MVFTWQSTIAVFSKQQKETKQTANNNKNINISNFDNKESDN